MRLNFDFDDNYIFLTLWIWWVNDRDQANEICLANFALGFFVLFSQLSNTRANVVNKMWSRLDLNQTSIALVVQSHAI